MKRVAWAGILSLGLIGTANATPITAYQNTNGLLFHTSTIPSRALDDGFFTPGPLAGGPVLITGLNLGYAVLGTGPAEMEIRIDFYDTLDPAAPPGSPVNSDPLGGITVTVGVNAPGVASTGMLDLSGLPGGGLLLPDDAWAIEVQFRVPGTTTPSTRGTPLFAGGEPGGGPSVGWSEDRFWRDANTNGTYDATDLRTVGGPPNRANFYLIIQTIPEPGTAMLLAAGSILLLWHRRR